MKQLSKKIILALTLLPTLSLAGFAANESSVPVSKVFTPFGFDSNDNSEIVVTGYLPNLCYHAPKSKVVVEGGKISVSVSASTKKFGMGACAQIIIPYTERIDIGVLDKGKYNITVNEDTPWEKRRDFAISEASSSAVDDNIYANVSEVTLSEEGSRKMLLKGYNPSDCFELKEIAIVDNGIDTFSVLPKMKQVKSFCPKKMIPFTYEFEVPEKLDADEVLLHVRVMDGRSVNAFFRNKPLSE